MYYKMGEGSSQAFGRAVFERACICFPYYLPQSYLVLYPYLCSALVAKYPVGAKHDLLSSFNNDIEV